MTILIHPGEILLEEFMEPHKLSANALAKKLNVPANRISEIARGNRDISADTAIRLATFFGTSAQFWLNLQTRFDLNKAEDLHAVEYEHIEAIAEAAYA